jgi:hypothetical protein
MKVTVLSLPHDRLPFRADPGPMPPGPPSVIAVLALEHRGTMGIVPLFNGRKHSDIVQELRDTLYVTHTLRQQMLTRVTGLAPEGAGADYSDGMSDLLSSLLR